MLKKAYMRMIARTAIFFMVFGALAPSVSHAFFAGTSQQMLQQICTTQGIKFVEPAKATSGAGQREHQAPALHMVDCLYCTILGHQDALSYIPLDTSFASVPFGHLTSSIAETMAVSAPYFNPPPRAPPALPSF